MSLSRMESSYKVLSTLFSPVRVFVAGTLVLLLVPIIIMNATNGHFGYPDTDGCACYVTYTTQESNSSCSKSRDQQCDFWLDRLLLPLSAVDFNK